MLFVFTLFLVCACQETSDVPSREDFLMLALQQKEIQCTFQSMQANISAQWDTMGELLDRHLPEDMPAEEKNNITLVRNANLIRMFQSFEKLDYSVKMELEELEKEDSLVVIKIQELKQKSQELERQRMDQFNAINLKYPQQAPRWAIQYDSILLTKCVTN